jgi:hypothetical protein
MGVLQWMRRRATELLIWLSALCTCVVDGTVENIGIRAPARQVVYIRQTVYNRQTVCAERRLHRAIQLVRGRGHDRARAYRCFTVYALAVVSLIILRSAVFLLFVLRLW